MRSGFLVTALAALIMTLLAPLANQASAGMGYDSACQPGMGYDCT
jgi:hypothetical protein